MNKKDVYYHLAKSLGLVREKLGNIRLTDGKVLPSHFLDVFKRIKIQIRGNARNGNIADEFSNKSKHPARFLNPEAPLLSFCHLLARESNRGTAKVRATCMQPIISKEVLTAFLAAQLEIDPASVDLHQKVRSIALPVSGYDKHSWVTFVIWADGIFGDNSLQNDLDSIADIAIEELFSKWVK